MPPILVLLFIRTHINLLQHVTDFPLSIFERINPTKKKPKYILLSYDESDFIAAIANVLKK